MFPHNYHKIYQSAIIFGPLSLTHLRRLHESHYDVLGVQKNSSTKEIKNAFIRLSKIHHPDKSVGSGSQGRFVKVLEAYNVLSKPERRRLYDNELEHILRSMKTQKAGTQQTNDKNRSTGYAYDDPSFWTNRAKSNYEERPYYGIPGVERVSNGTIAFLCIILASISGFVQFMAIRHSITSKSKEQLKRSNANKRMLEEIKEQTDKNGPELQLKILEDRLLNSKFYTASDKK